MSTTTLISQPSASARSLRVSAASVYAVAAATAVVPAANGNAVTTGFGHDMAWLGGLGENVKFSDTKCTKRITTGRLERVLT